MALILTLTVTNWSSVGSFTDLGGARFDVMAGTPQTNTVAVIEWEGEKREFVLRSMAGVPLPDHRLVAFTNSAFPPPLPVLPGGHTNPYIRLQTRLGKE